MNSAELEIFDAIRQVRRGPRVIRYLCFICKGYQRYRIGTVVEFRRHSRLQLSEHPLELFLGYSDQRTTDQRWRIWTNDRRDETNKNLFGLELLRTSRLEDKGRRRYPSSGMGIVPGGFDLFVHAGRFSERYRYARRSLFD